MTDEKLNRKRKQYACLRKKWDDMIANDHRNAIWRQMDGMVDEEVWFKTIMTIRGRAGNPAVNAQLWETFLTGYGVKQALAIRRLTDLTRRGKPTASLANIVEQIKVNANLLTRDVVIGHDGTPMCVEPEEGISYTWVRGSDGLPAVDSKMRAHLDAEHKHAAFDRLREGKSIGDERRPDDHISPLVLDRLSSALSEAAIARVRDWCDTCLAHADLKDMTDQASPTYNDIHHSIRTLVEVYQFLCVDFLQTRASSVVAIHQQGYLDLLSSPLVPPMGVEAFADTWHEHAEEMEEWGKTPWFRRFAIQEGVA
jgi:hypothetical protein